jgi:hypothetical protein
MRKEKIQIGKIRNEKWEIKKEHQGNPGKHQGLH